jgi:hypothetical protein
VGSNPTLSANFRVAKVGGRSLGEAGLLTSTIIIHTIKATMSRPIRAILSTENLLHNVSVMRQKAPHAKMIAMVKANAYGHGLTHLQR